MRTSNISKILNGIFSVLLAAAPYIYLVLICFIVPIDFPLGENAAKQIVLPYLVVVVITCIPNIIFAFMVLKLKVDASPVQLAFWCMFVKLFYIPLYLVAFILAAVIAIGLLLFGGPIIAAVIAFMVYVFLRTSSALGICALKQAQRQRIFDSQFVRTQTTYLLSFGRDIISAVAIYKILKQATANKNEN